MYSCSLDGVLESRLGSEEGVKNQPFCAFNTVKGGFISKESFAYTGLRKIFLLQTIYQLCEFQEVLQLCNEHHNQFLKYILSPKVPACRWFLFPHPASTYLLSISIVLLFLEISHKWNHTICSFICLLSQDVSQDVVAGDIGTSFIFIVEQYQIVWIHPIVFIHSPTGYLGIFYYFDYFE